MRYLITICILSTTLYATEEARLPGYRTTYPMQSIDIAHHSTLSSKTKKNSFGYRDTFATTIFGSTNDNVEYIIGIRNIYMNLDSKILPSSTQYGIFGVHTLYTKLPNWTVLGNAVIQPNLKNLDLSKKTRYVASFQGRYSFNSSTGGYIGIYTDFGMKSKNIKPILGFEHTKGNWKYRAIYPIKAGISYGGMKKNIFSIMWRPFRTTMFSNENSSIITYTASAVEFRWDYLPSPRWDVWFTIGQTLKEKIEIGNSHNHNRSSFTTHSTNYTQLGLSFFFANKQ